MVIQNLSIFFSHATVTFSSAITAVIYFAHRDKKVAKGIRTSKKTKQWKM